MIVKLELKMIHSVRFESMILKLELKMIHSVRF